MNSIDNLPLIADRITASFAVLKATEPFLFDHPRRPEDLRRPSGSFEARIAHHLRNPTFTTHNLSEHETAENTNSCLGILLDSGSNEKNSLVFDHFARRDVVDALRSYRLSVIACHERFTADLRSGMKAVVEVVYGDAIQSQLLNALKLEPFPLWGKFKKVPVYLEWAYDRNDNPATQSKVLRFIVFAYQPQAFVFS